MDKDALLCRVACWLCGHRYHIKQRFGPRARRVECLRCGLEWAMHDPTQSFNRWDDDYAELYRFLGYTVLK